MTPPFSKYRYHVAIWMLVGLFALGALAQLAVHSVKALMR